MTVSAKQTDKLDGYCPRSKSGRHTTNVQTRRDHGTTGTCRHCGATVHRAHRRSPVWWLNLSRNERRPL